MVGQLTETSANLGVLCGDQFRAGISRFTFRGPMGFLRLARTARAMEEP